jgi:hypothetical protein
MVSLHIRIGVKGFGNMPSRIQCIKYINTLQTWTQMGHEQKKKIFFVWQDLNLDLLDTLANFSMQLLVSPFYFIFWPRAFYRYNN